MFDTTPRPLYPREMINKYNENNPSDIVLCKVSGSRITRNILVP